MKVLAHDEKDVKQVIIGQKHQTEEFEIANTPAMMNILSSGLYENPLKAVVREIMFNAWDAQKDNNKQDQPIEVTVNIDNGILIRDFGTGIPQDKIHKIYCVYGASTKTQVKTATGGFGFGTKAPFSYADAFTVISHHDGVKSVNLINKIGEDTGGKPGRTLIAQVPTEESGIAVTVGLKNIEDVEKIVKHVKNIMFLSGMKVLFTYNLSEDNHPDHTVVGLLEDDGIMDNQMVIRNSREERGNDRSGIYAVYGGVRYSIPDNEVYEDAYKRLRIFTRNNGAVYFGFAPDTLTPQPSRDGLNMSELSIDSIREIISTTSEEIIDLVDEAFLIGLEAFISTQAKYEVPPHFLIQEAYNWYVEGGRGNLDNLMIDVTSFANGIITDRTANYSWFNILKTVEKDISYLFSFSNFSKEDRIVQLGKMFQKYLPKERDIYRIFRTITTSKDSRGYEFDFAKSLRDYITSDVLTDLYKFEQKAAQVIENPRQYPQLRIKNAVGSSSSWDKTTRDRTEVKRRKYRDDYYARTSKFLDKPSVPTIERAWGITHKKASRIARMFLRKKVILVQTASRLQVTDYKTPMEFSNNPRVSLHKYASYGHAGLAGHMPAYIVPKAKGAYDKAKEILLKMGYEVFEIKEKVYEIERPESVPTEIIPYRLNPRRSGWFDHEDIVTTKPEYYLKINFNSLGSRTKCPSSRLVQKFMEEHPDVILCTNLREQKPMVKAGAKNIVEWFQEWTENFIKDKRLLRKVIRYHIVEGETTDLSDKLRKSAAFRKEVGVNLTNMTPDEFDRVYLYFNEILSTEYEEFLTCSANLSSAVDAITAKDKVRLEKNEKFFKKLNVFNQYRIEEKLRKIKGDNMEVEREALAKQIIRIAKTL